jgi:hypothetical protein
MRVAFWILTLGLVARPATAQAPDAKSGVKIGLGVFLNPSAILGDGGGLDGLFLPIGLGNFTVPVLLGSRVRLEPEFGFVSVSSEFTPAGGAETFSVSQSVWRYGLNAHVVILERGDLRPYAGLRVGWMRYSSRQTTTTDEFETSRGDTYYGLAVGGEYFVSPFFSLGGEIQVNRVSLGDEETTPTPPFPSGDSDTRFWSTNGLVGLRLYLVDF